MIWNQEKISLSLVLNQSMPILTFIPSKTMAVCKKGSAPNPTGMSRE